jgi:hypothetical protein
MLAIPLLASSAGATVQDLGLPSPQVSVPQSSDQLDAILPDYRPQIASVLDHPLTAYTIDVTLEAGPDAGVLTGSAGIDYVNDTGAPIDEVPIRLYANGTVDAIVITAATVAGTPVEPELSVYNSVATLPLGEELAPEASIALHLDFSVTVPFGNVLHYGILGIDPEDDTWALAHWYPLVAGWVDGEGWELDPPSYKGDPIFSTVSTYDVTIHAPAAMHLVTSGVVEQQETSGDTQTARYVTGPSRDFTIVADDDFIATSIEVNGTTINSWYLPGEETNGEAVATYAGRALEYFNELIGPYPYAELDLLSVEVYGALGVEFPQLIYMARDYYSRDLALNEPNNLEFTVAHEVLHQWWYGMVGNNQYEHAFIDEGLTNYISGDLYFRHVYGDAPGQAMSESAFRNPYRNGLDNRGDRIVDTPSDDFSTDSDYVFAMYFKAPMGFAAIHDEIGDAAFTAGLRAYYTEFRFDIADPTDLLHAFEMASGQELDDLWNLWFEETIDAPG